TYGENLAFNIWRALAEHEPVGSLAEARKIVYRASARSRRDVNGLPLGEPAEPRPAEWRPGEPYPEGKDERIVRAAIYPAVGVSRLGNSDQHYIGPEVYPAPPRPDGFYRDATGALERQAARFRIYGYNCRGEVVRELTSGFADIRWKVHVANRKAEWYQWVIALDIPEAAGTKCPRRNPKVEHRADLVIDAGNVEIRGASQSGDAYSCAGKFMGEDVELGRLETDEAGRLIFVPAAGVSGSPTGAPIYDPENNPNAFINADGWYDDICDGPVNAEVTLEGRRIPCEGAWVLSAPPDYAPDVVSVRTLYDLLQDLFIQNQWLEFPSEISFRRDVYPILRRFSALGWVNKGYAVQYGLAGPYPFEDPELVARLSDRGPKGRGGIGAELRRQIFNTFRIPSDPTPEQLPWPWLYGDAMEVPAGDSPRQNTTVSETQYRILEAWADGSFTDDWNGGTGAHRDLDDLPLAERPNMLTRAALEYCLADAFHPGCEVTWPIRHLSMWRAPFRLDPRPPGEPEPDYGKVMTPEIAESPDGPLNAQGPGDLTRWMGLPWQADTAFCRSGYDRSYDPYVPTFWPATVPNQVLTPEIYRKIMAAETPEKRFEAFLQRFPWVAPLAPKPPIA
ncbi:MAG: LodA/GoxA family CTQ-dependent oxidase, partial [Holophagales bacterium]|nr:LodA/GoxA family CTQ-dependent oxidase [Holophagales bacterium]